MRFLIAGLGSIGRRHLRNLLALGERDIVLLRSFRGAAANDTLLDGELAAFPDDAAAASARITTETDLASALAHKPDAVIVANPTALHLQVAIPAAEAGCHLFLEKPISHSMEGVPELRQAVQQGGGQVFTGFQFRFHPGLQQAKELLQAGFIGRPLSARAHWGEYLPGWHPWEDYRRGYSARADLGGGVVLTLSHPLDYLRWMLGEVSALWAFTGRLGDLELDVEDTAEVGLQFTNGALASLHLDYNQRPPAHFLEIIGTSGVLRWDNQDGRVQVNRASSDASVSDVTHSEPPLRASELPLRAVDPFVDRDALFISEMRHFLDLIRGLAAPGCTLEDGLRALELALAVHQSAREGKVVRW